MMSPADDAMRAGSDAIRVGAELREARERLGWSLSDVAANLRIRYVYLLALEEGRVADLPGMAYAIGFLRAYAKLLGLDPNDMSRRLRAEAGADRKTELEFPAPVPDRGVPAGVVVLLGVVLAIGAYVAWYRVSGDRPDPTPVQAVPDRLATLPDPSSAPPAKPGGKPDPATSGAGLSPDRHAPNSSAPQGTSQSTGFAAIPPSSAAAAVPPAGASAGPPKSAAGSSAATPGSAATGVGPTAQPTPDNSHLVVRARTDTWVQVRERQGQVLLNRVLRSGETWPVPPQSPGQQLLLTTGNAGGTELLVDGVVAPAIGPTGMVKRDVPLDISLIREGKLQPPATAAKAPGGSRPQSVQQ
jgi:cytoskeleton protein RodZ